jgi:hypothetical protein
MMQYAWTILKSILLGLIPYADPVRRRRARRTARAVIRTRTWPPRDADVTGRHFAELALLRILHLQLECRRAARHGMTESSIAISRISIEVALFGLYCVYNEQAIDQIKAKNVAALRNLLNFLVTADVISDSFLKNSLAALGTTKDRLSVSAMATYIDKKWGTAHARSLYTGYYAALSTLFVHANGFSLIRYVRRGGKLSERPRLVWARRSATHSVDTSLALLAIALADTEDSHRTSLKLYGEAHAKRILTPLFVMAGMGVRHSWSLHNGLPVIKAIRRMREYTRSPQAMADTRETRTERIGSGFDEIFRLFHSDELPDDVIIIFRDYFVNKVVDDIAKQATTGTQ